MAQGRTLARLIDDRAADLGMSFERLARRARDEGFELTKTTLAAFRNHDLTESPKRRTMEAVAVALDVSYPEVVLAVARSMVGDAGEFVEVATEQRVRSWVTLTDGRTDAQVAALLRVVRTVTATLDASHANGAVGGDAGEPSARSSIGEQRRLAHP